MYCRWHFVDIFKLKPYQFYHTTCYAFTYHWCHLKRYSWKPYSQVRDTFWSQRFTWWTTTLFEKIWDQSNICNSVISPRCQMGVMASQITGKSTVGSAGDAYGLNGKIDKALFPHPPRSCICCWQQIELKLNVLYIQSIFLYRSCLFQLHVPGHPFLSNGGNLNCPAKVGACILPQLWFILIFMPGDAYMPRFDMLIYATLPWGLVKNQLVAILVNVVLFEKRIF